VENTVQTDRQVTDDKIIRCMRFACWITEAKNTHSHKEDPSTDGRITLNRIFAK